MTWFRKCRGSWHDHASWLLAGGADLQVVASAPVMGAFARPSGTCTRCLTPTSPCSAPWPRSGTVRRQAEDASSGRAGLPVACASMARTDRSISCAYSSMSSRSRAWSSHFWSGSPAVQSVHGAATRARGRRSRPRTPASAGTADAYRPPASGAAHCCGPLLSIFQGLRRSCTGVVHLLVALTVSGASCARSWLAPRRTCVQERFLVPRP